LWQNGSKMIILFMDVYKSGLSGFVILAGTDIRRNSYMMDNFGRQKFNSDGQFRASHTDTRTDTLLSFRENR
jgi:hypothetical protein